MRSVRPEVVRAHPCPTCEAAAGDLCYGKTRPHRKERNCPARVASAAAGSPKPALITDLCWSHPIPGATHECIDDPTCCAYCEVPLAKNKVVMSARKKAYLFVGDTHNDLDFVESATRLARQHGAEIVQLGDWGFLWPGGDQLDELSDLLVGNGVTMRFIDGNHDDHPRLRKLRGRVRRAGATAIAPHVIYQPRGSVYEDEDGTRLLFLGGAPSIDRGLRTAGVSWWPEEVITEPEFCFARSAKGPIHVLVTHDAPTFPPGFSPKGSPSYQHDQLRSMRYVDELIRHHRPRLHVHGHWHTRATTSRGATRVEALDCNQLDSAYLSNSTLLWSRDTEVP